MRSLIIVRTHRADRASIEAFDRLAATAGLDVVFGLDERAGRIDVSGRPAIGYTEATLTAMGLYAHPQCGWRCGDYVYYAVRAARADYNHYWLIEPDVRINVSNLSAFFASFADNQNDFIAPRFGQRDDRWEWSSTVSRAGLRPYGCVFPITRMSARGIDAAYALRRAHSTDPALATPTNWPNDEGFVASGLVAGGFACGDLSNGGAPVYNLASLAIGAVVDFTLIETMPPDGLIYHPVRDFVDWVSRGEARLLQITGARSGDADAGRLRSEASFLNSLAETCLRNPRYEDAALLPLMLAQPRWAAREWAESLPPANGAADANRAQIAAARLARRFGVSQRAPAVATAHVATSTVKSDSLSVADPGDFSLGPAYPLGHFPRGFALPFAFDFEAKELLFTVHLRVEEVLAQPFLYAAQRQRGRVVLRVPFSGLEQIFGAPDQNRSPVLIFSIGRTGSTLLERLIACVTSRSVSEPDTISQLGVRRQVFAALPPPLRKRLIYYGIAPFFDVALDKAEDARCVVKFRSQANAISGAVADTFPRAKYVFMLRDREAWARSTFRAFKLRPDIAADRLATGVRALHVLRQKQIDLTIVPYEDVVADPVNQVTALMGITASGALRDRLGAVMDKDSQANLRIGRARTAAAHAGEAEWMATFEAAWAARRPADLISEIGITL